MPMLPRNIGVDPNGSIVYFEITTQMTAVAGDIIAVVELSIITEVAQTGYIYIKVDKNPVPQDTIESTNEFKSIYEYAEDAKDSAENAERAATASAHHSGLSITSAAEAAEYAEELRGGIEDVADVKKNLITGG